MWSVIFIALLVTAVLFMLLGFIFVEKDNLMLATTFILVTTVIWFTLSAAVIEIEFPYTAIQNNNTIVTGTHTWGDSTAVSLMYFFMLMGVIEMFYGLGTIPFMVFNQYQKRHADKFGKRSKYYKKFYKI